MKLIASLLRDSLGITVIAIAAGIIAGIGNTFLLASINTELARDAGSSSNTLLWLFIGLCLVVAASRFISTDLMMRLAQRNLSDLRMKLGRRVVSAPLRLQEEIGVTRILAVFTEDIPAITSAVVAIPTVCTNFVIVVGCLIYLSLISGKLLLGVIGFLIFGVITCQLPVVRATRYLKAVRQESDNLLKELNAMTQGIKELKIHRRRREAFLSNLLSTTARSLQRNNVVSNSIFNAVNSWAQTLIFILMGLLVFMPRSWINLDPFSLMAYVLVILFMIGPLMLVMSSIPVLSRAGISMKKLDELGLSLAKLPAESDATNSPDIEAAWHTLTLSGVKHSYHSAEESSSFVLGPLNLTLRPGEIVFVTGGNGSGKTTLAKLLTGLYVPEEGELRFNDQPVTNENRDYFRQHFSIIFSDAYIFETLLGLDKPELDEEAQRYLTQFQIAHKVQVKDGVLSTVDLSQGQRKRLALLTAYLEDRPIYVFDEWAADQDPQFRDIFYYQLLPGLKARGKAVVVISHDDRYYHLADRIVKLDYGKIVSNESTKDSPVGSVVPVTA